MIIHTVQKGDSIYSISKRYGVPVQSVIMDNDLGNTAHLTIGQAIVVMAPKTVHTVKAGDSLYSIARTYGTTVSAILRENPNILNPSQLYVGQKIIIPVPPQKLGTIQVNAYVLPGIGNTTLANTLPNLTYASIFGYSVNADGSLNPVDDIVIIEKAINQQVAPWLTITNTIEGEGFSSDLANSILTNEAVQDTLLNNIIQTMSSKNYKGLNIDFEYVYPRDRENYNNFLRKTVDKLRPLGYTVSTALAPKLGSNQQGLLYEAHDYAAHGEIVDYVILMTYEWGYMYGPAQAVAPVNKVRQVLDYAVSAIPSQKILMGMPNYGYDWTLPFVKGSAARPISNTGAVQLAERVGAQIQFDEQAQSPFFYYYDSSGKEHVVWFEDARSVEAKLLLVDEYNLGGVSYWNANNYFPQNWLVLNAMYDVEKVL